jgi:hypothetical protein
VFRSVETNVSPNESAFHAQGGYTGAHRTIAFRQHAPNTVTLGLTLPPTLSLRGDRYPLPIRSGALRDDARARAKKTIGESIRRRPLPRNRTSCISRWCHRRRR